MKGVYPFHDGKYEDFARVFDYLIKVSILPISLFEANTRLVSNIGRITSMTAIVTPTRLPLIPSVMI